MNTGRSTRRRAVEGACRVRVLPISGLEGSCVDGGHYPRPTEPTRNSGASLSSLHSPCHSHPSSSRPHALREEELCGCWDGHLGGGRSQARTCMPVASMISPDALHSVQVLVLLNSCWVSPLDLRLAILGTHVSSLFFIRRDLRPG